MTEESSGGAPMVYTREEVRQILRVGRHTADKICREIGIRISPRRIVVPRLALERWLAGDYQGNGSGPSGK